MKLFDILIVMMNLKKKMVHRLAKNRRFTENNCVHMQTFLYMYIRALVSVYRATSASKRKACNLECYILYSRVRHFRHFETRNNQEKKKLNVKPSSLYNDKNRTEKGQQISQCLDKILA